MSFHSLQKESQQSGYDSNSNEDRQLRNEYQQQQEHRQMESLQEILFQWIQETNEGKIFAEKNSGWDMTIPVCEWKGIMCIDATDPSTSTLMMIQSIHLSNQNLTGTISSQLGKITSLLDIDLSSNKFTGTLPSQLLTLPKLQRLDVSRNKLQGNIPWKSISTSLATLHLGHNQFSGTLPQSVFRHNNNPDSISKLQVLNIQYNRLHGTLPSTFAALTSIQSLDLSNNQFIGTIPSVLSELTTLNGLYLSNNQLSGTIPPQLGNPKLPLTDMYLHGNELTGTIPATLADLRTLQTLFIDENKLTGVIPPELCAQNLNEVFFHETLNYQSTDVDSSYSDLYGQRRQKRRRLDRDSDSTIEERNGCNSIACPVGTKSKGENNKDGVFPCEPCGSQKLNPYLGANTCFALTQETILSSFYDATNGSQWKASENTQTWALDDTPVCQRKGITCNDAQQITHIVLRDMGLSGTLPADLGFLSRLVELDVSQNNIHGKLPSELRFAPLELLDISQNQMTGIVPSGLCRKGGINGNGLNGLFSCDVIACQGGTYASRGRSDPGSSGDFCQVCDNPTPMYLGSTSCYYGEITSNKGLTPFGFVGELGMAIIGIFILGTACFIWQRSQVSTDYITNRAYFEHGPGKEEWSRSDGSSLSSNGRNYHHHPQHHDGNDEEDPLSGIDDIGSGTGRHNTNTTSLNFNVKIKDEWAGEKPSIKDATAKEVWLDVPKIS